MSLLNRFNKSPKGDSFRIVENPIKYVGYVLSEIFRKGRASNTAAGNKQRSNPSSTATTDNSKGTQPK